MSNLTEQEIEASIKILQNGVAEAVRRNDHNQIIELTEKISSLSLELSQRRGERIEPDRTSYYDDATSRFERKK